MRNRFAIGAGDQTANGVAGGNSFPAISASQMPVHNHTITDNGHGHGVNDAGHAHGVNDVGHTHPYGVSLGSNPGPGPGWYTGGNNVGAAPATAMAHTGIGINPGGTGIAIYGSGTGITVNNAGTGTAFDNRPAFVGLYYIMKS
jgi:hypothetical protein